MTDDDEIALAKRLPKGARRALLAMTAVPTLPGRATFNANGAFNLTWFARSYGGLATYVVKDRRAAYSLTPLGERIRQRLLASVDTRRMAETVKQGSVRSTGGAVPDRADAHNTPSEIRND